MGPFLNVDQPVRKRKRFFFLHENEREKNIAEAQRKKFMRFGGMTNGYFLTLEVFWFADGYSSYIINVLSIMFIIFLTAEKFWNHFLLICKVDVVDYVVEVYDGGIDDSSVERWLFLCWKPCRSFGWRIRVEREASFFVLDETLLRRRKVIRAGHH